MRRLWLGGHAGREAMARRGAVTCGPAGSQGGATALVLAADHGHKDTVELLLDRGANLEAKDRVSAAAMCCCATGRAGRHGRARGGDGDDASGRGAPVAGRRVTRRLAGAQVSREAMVRQGAVTCGPEVPQYGATALVLAASSGRKDTVEMLVDRGADLEAQDRVSAAARCCCATGRAGRHGRVGGGGDGDNVSGRRALVAGRRVRWRWRGGVMSAEER